MGMGKVFWVLARLTRDLVDFGGEAGARLLQDLDVVVHEPLPLEVLSSHEADEREVACHLPHIQHLRRGEGSRDRLTVLKIIIKLLLLLLSCTCASL